jgi:hypothetical protein
MRYQRLILIAFLIVAQLLSSGCFVRVPVFVGPGYYGHPYGHGYGRE